MRTFNLLCVCICFVGPLSQAAERPTLIKTNDPRPDILPRPFYDNHVEYRARYNRPRFIGGLLAYEVSRTSQEAMVWKENYCAGNYDQHHTPPVYKSYYYPKPWEVLTVGARPNFASSKPAMQRVPGPTTSEEIDEAEDIAKEASSKSEADVKSSERADEAGQSDVKGGINLKGEVVPSPSDKTSSRATSKPRSAPL